MKVYGITTCGSVKKALAFFKANNIPHTFVDLKKEPVSRATIEGWAAKVPLEKLFNNKGTKYRTLGLAKENLSDTDKLDWLAKENLLIKRPIVELDDGSVMVAFDETLYQKTFGV